MIAYIISDCDHHRTALETIEKLSHTLDFSDYASQIIHAIIQVHTHFAILYT